MAESEADVHLNRRKVEWLQVGVPRATFSQSALHEIGSAMTLFGVRNHAAEFLEFLGAPADQLRDRIGDDDGAVILAEDEPNAQHGDLLLTTTDRGFKVRMLDGGEPISGLHPLVIRARDSVDPFWLLLWTRTQVFASLIGRYAKGTTIRSLSVKDVAQFELEVPPAAVQAETKQLIRGLEEIEFMRTTLLETLDQLRSVEHRLAYAEVTQ